MTNRPLSTISVRLTGEIRDRLGVYMEASGLSLSETVRVLLDAALRDEGESIDDAVSRAAIKQGVLRGTAYVNGRLAAVFAEILSEVA